MDQPKKSRFRIEKLEERIAPAPAAVLIKSVKLSDPGVNGAEHACKGLSNNNPHDGLQLYRHGCRPAPCPPPPPPCPPPPPPPPCPPPPCGW